MRRVVPSHAKQVAKSLADEAFMKYVRSNRSKASFRPTLEASREDHELDALFDAMQFSRDEYGPLEYEYNRLEDELDEEEFQLALVEGRFYNSPEARRDPDTAAVPDTPEDTRRSPENLYEGSSTVSSIPENSIQEQHLSSLGDLDLLKEQHSNMLQDRKHLLSMQEARAAMSIVLSEDETDFLEHFAAREAALKEQMVEVEAEIERWKGQCLDKGISMADSVDESLPERRGEPEVGNCTVNF